MWYLDTTKKPTQGEVCLIGSLDFALKQLRVPQRIWEHADGFVYKTVK